MFGKQPIVGPMQNNDDQDAKQYSYQLRSAMVRQLHTHPSSIKSQRMGADTETASMRDHYIRMGLRK